MATYRVTYIRRSGSIAHEAIEAANSEEALKLAKKTYDDVVHVKRMRLQGADDSCGKEKSVPTFSLIFLVLILVGIGALVRYLSR